MCVLTENLSKMIRKLILSALLLCTYTYALPATMERMTVSKMRMADLETSASGYVYNQQQGLPASYVQYTNHGSGRYYHAPDTVHYVLGAVAPVAPVVSETAAHYEPTVLAYATADHQATPYAEQQPYVEPENANYAVEQLPKYNQPIVSEKEEPRAPYYGETGKVSDESAADTVSEDNSEHDDDEHDDHSEDSDNGDEHDDDDDDDDDNEDDDHASHDFGVSGKFDYHGNDNSGKGSGFESAGKGASGLNGYSGSSEAGNGKESSSSAYQAGGEDGEKGYNSYHEFDKGEKGHYDNENKKGYYDEEGGHKHAKTDAAGEYGSSHDEEKSESGSDYGKESYHKKGQKTSGFHNVYHKDEYKKDSDFYDDAHKEGHFEKYDSLNKKHKAAEGGFKKGDNHYAGFEHAEKGKKGHFDKGHEISHDQGYKTKEGEDSYHDNHAEYAKEGSASSSKNYGFSDGNDHH